MEIKNEFGLNLPHESFCDDEVLSFILEDNDDNDKPSAL